MNNKGFTLVELLATITIMGIITALAFPAISNLVSANAEKEYQAYEKSMLNATKIYYENHRAATSINMNELINAKLLKRFDKKNITCSGHVDITKDSSQHVIYKTHLKCVQGTGASTKTLYET